MCSRYYIDPGMMEDISRVVQNIDGRIRLVQGDIRPTDVAPVIGQSEYGLELGMCRWGYPLSKGKNPVINARVETVMDKPSFQNGILYHRLLIPTDGFYEWNSQKEKSTFSRSDSSVLYMAGFCDWFKNERRFVILTTAANDSMKKTHDRMPLILEKEQIADWFDNSKMSALLYQTPALLNRQTEYEQQSLFS
ncbi:SOS response-associated peptidase [Ruminococcus sp. OM08-7]|nr:SOS response-associated peptidase [Ruminococcus sp. OM08-7]